MPATKHSRGTAGWRWLGLAGLLLSQASMAFQVCVGDGPVPPFLGGDPKHLGVSERLMIDAGKQVGLQIELLRWPARRCYEQMRLGNVQAAIGAAIPANLQEFDFPGSPPGDPQLRVARSSLVLVKRQDANILWDGRKLELPQGQAVRIGARGGFRAGAEAARRLGLELAPSPAQSAQVLRMVQLDRMDVAVVVLEEADYLLSRPEHAGLVRMDPPLMVNDYFVATHRMLPEAERQLVRRWWELMAQWRDLPAYRPPPP